MIARLTIPEQLLSRSELLCLGLRGTPVLRRDNLDENPATIRMRMRRCWR